MEFIQRSLPRTPKFGLDARTSCVLPEHSGLTLVIAFITLNCNCFIFLLHQMWTLWGQGLHLFISLLYHMAHSRASDTEGRQEGRNHVLILAPQTLGMAVLFGVMFLWGSCNHFQEGQRSQNEEESCRFTFEAKQFVYCQEFAGNI